MRSSSFRDLPASFCSKAWSWGASLQGLSCGSALSVFLPDSLHSPRTGSLQGLMERGEWWGAEGREQKNRSIIFFFLRNFFKSVIHFSIVLGLLSLQSTGSELAGISNCGAWLSCSAACRVLADQGSNLCLLQWQVVASPLNHQDIPSNSSMTAELPAL